MSVTLARDGEVVTLTIDDGKVNALGSAVIEELRAALRSVEPCAALVLTGRPGVFTAGLDTRELAGLQSRGRARLFEQFAQMLLDLWVAPYPVVCAVTGHAVAAGTLLAVVSDHVVAADGDFRWGMTEGRIGLELSDFSIMLVRSRVAPVDLDRLMLQGAVLGPREAVAVGYAHEAVAAAVVGARAAEVARTMADLPQPAYARNKLRLRGERASAARARLDLDIAGLVATDIVASPPRY